MQRFLVALALVVMVLAGDAGSADAQSYNCTQNWWGGASCTSYGGSYGTAYCDRVSSWGETSCNDSRGNFTFTWPQQSYSSSYSNLLSQPVPATRQTSALDRLLGGYDSSGGGSALCRFVSC